MARVKKLPPGLWKRSGVYYADFRAQDRRIRKRLSRDFRTACELLTELQARAKRKPPRVPPHGQHGSRHAFNDAELGR